MYMNFPNLFALITIMFITTSVQGQSMSHTDWKLKLRYGKETTPYTYFTVLAEGICGDMVEGYSCPKGNAIMAIKVWATDIDEPPRENPHGYDIQFTPFDSL